MRPNYSNADFSTDRTVDKNPPTFANPF